MSRYDVVLTNGKVDRLVTVNAPSARAAGAYATNPDPRRASTGGAFWEIKAINKIASGRVKRRASIPAHIARVIAEANADA